MKKSKHPYGYYRRPCIIDIRPIPGLSNNYLRMNHIISNRTHTLIRWMNKQWNSENKAIWTNWNNKLDAYGINKRGNFS